MAEAKMTTVCRKYVLIPERSDSNLWERRVIEYTKADLESRIAYYEDLLSTSKKKEVKEKAKTRLAALNEQLESFMTDFEITQAVINNYTYGLVRTAQKEEAARKNYIVEYVRMVLVREHAYAMDPKERSKRINEILRYAYRKRGSKSGSLLDETEIGNILGSYGIGFQQMLTRKIQDCCYKGALEGRCSFPFFKEDSPFTVLKAAMGFSHDYDSYDELCEHLDDCKLYFDYGGNGKPHIARFRIDVGYGKKRRNAMGLLLKVYSGEYSFCGSSIQISKNKIILNLTVQMPKKPAKLDEDVVVGVCMDWSAPATCALNNDNYQKMVIGDRQDFLTKRQAFQMRRRTLQKNLKDSYNGHGRKRKLEGLDQLKTAERNYVDTYCHMISKRIVEFAVENNAKYINMEKVPASEDLFIKRNSIASQVHRFVQYKALQYNIIVRIVNPCYNDEICSIDGTWSPEQDDPKTEFKCANPDCKSHTLYKRGFDADFNHAKNIAASTLFTENGSVNEKAWAEAREYYGIAEEYKDSLEKKESE